MPISAQSTVNPLSLPIEWSATVEGALDLPGQQDRFNLQVTSGQRLFFDSLDADADSIYVRLTSPSGQVLWEFESRYDSWPFYALEDGTYTLTLFASGDTVGDYRFRILNLANAGNMVFGLEIAGRLDPPAGTLAYQFEAVAGQRLKFESLSATHAHANWCLVDPGGQELLTGSISDDLGEVIVARPGTHLILVRGFPIDDQTLDFAILGKLVSNPVGQSSGFGSVRSGIINPGETVTFPYTAPAGTLAYFDHLGSDASWLWADLRAPDGNSVLSAWALSDAGPVVLPISGEYLLELRATEASNPATYALRLLDLGTSESVTGDGEVLSGLMDPPDLTAAYRFQGWPGQRLHLDFVDTTPWTIHPQLIGPSGQELYAPGIWSDQDRQFQIMEPGTHHLLLRTATGLPISHQFRLLDLAEPPTRLLLPDSPVQGVMDRGWQTDLFRFDGQAGHRLFFDFTQLADDAGWQLTAPGNAFFNSWNPDGDLEIVLPETGVYSVAVTSGAESPAAYQFEVITANTTTLPLQLGHITEGTLTTRGERADFVFQGTVGQKLFFDGLDTELIRLVTRLVAPDGNLVFQLEGGDSAPFMLPLNGIYRLEVGGDSDDLGYFQFRLLDCAQPPVSLLPLDQPFAGIIDPATELDFFRLEGSAGTRLFIDSLDETANCAWALYGPRLQVIASTSLDQDVAVVLPDAGDYLLSVFAASADPRPYSFVVRPADPFTAPLTLDVPVSGSLSQPGVEHRYTFTGSAGMRIYHDALSADLNDIPLTLLDPNSQSVLSMNAAADYGPLRLTQSGTYTVVLGEANDSPANYHFRLLDLDTADELATELIGQLDPPDETDLLRFGGQSGQRVLLEQLEPIGDQAGWRLVSPSGQTLAQNNTLVSFSELTLRESGAYHVLIEGALNAPSPLNYRIRRTTTEPSSTPSGFGVLHSGNIGIAETHVFTYTASAGLQVYFDSLITPGSSLQLELFHAGGGVVLSGDATADSGPLWLPESGTYTLTIRGQSSSSTGDYRFRLLDLAGDSIPIAMGEAMNETPLEPFATRAFQFTGTTGQQLYYDVLVPENPNYTSLLGLGPDGHHYFGGSSATSDYGPLALLVPGNYILLVQNWSADAVTASFRLVDLLAEPVQTIALGELAEGLLDPPQQTHFYRIPIAGVSRLFFRGTEASWGAFWTLHSPDLARGFGGNYGGSDHEFDVFGPDGDYLLVIREIGSDPVAYSFGLYASIAASAPLEFGGAVTGSTPAAGGEKRFTFNGSAGQLIYYDALGQPSDSADLALISPTGVRLAYGNAATDLGPILLTETGSYSLALDNRAFDAVSYHFRLLDGATQPHLALDIPVETTLDGFHTHLYQLEPPPGLRLYFDSLDTHYLEGYWSFHAPNGYQIVGDALVWNFQATPSYPGTYWLVVSNGGPEPITHSFQVIPGNHAPVSHAVADAEINEGTTLQFHLNASDLEQPNDVLTFAFVGEPPAGAVVDPSNGQFHWTPDEDQGPGQYAISVRVTDDGLPPLSDTTTFNVRVHEVNRPPAIDPMPDQTIHAGAAVRLSILASDLDVPANSMSFALLQAPPHATIDAASGIFNWDSSLADAGLAFPVEVQITDDGVRALSANTAFQITVVQPLRIDAVQRTDGGLELRWLGIAGRSYRVQSRNHLDSTWLDLGVDIPGSGGVTTALVPLAEDVVALYYRLRETP